VVASIPWFQFDFNISLICYCHSQVRILNSLDKDTGPWLSPTVGFAVNQTATVQLMHRLNPLIQSTRLYFVHYHTDGNFGLH
jgi:hypothetical protein